MQNKMMFRVYLCAIFLLVLNHYDVVANYADECLTPMNEAGQCMPIKSCSGIMASLNELSRPIPEALKGFIMQSYCGKLNGVIHVCCPKKDIVLNIDGMQQLNVSCGLFDLPRVAHGQEAVLFVFPWMALLKYDVAVNPFKCGGTLINERYVLTAAHCVVGLDYSLSEVRLGEHQISTTVDCQYFGNEKVCAPPVEDIAIEEIIPHPKYSRSEIKNDIALIRLKQPVVFKQHIKPICLPVTEELMNVVPENFFVSGWGLTETGNSSDVLMYANLPNKNHNSCNEAFKFFKISPNQLCVGGNNRQDSCRGDSGGPLAQIGRYKGKVRLVQFGIVSFGIISCGVENLPAVYTNVQHFMQWITDNIRK